MENIRSTTAKLFSSFLLILALATAILSGTGAANLLSESAAGITLAYTPELDGGMPPPDLD